MTREELREKLIVKGVHESLYSLDCLAKQSESYSVIQENGIWKVVYKERGVVSEIATGLTQDEAYDLVYREFRAMYGWTD
jgi:hypothetical protein